MAKIIIKIEKEDIKTTLIGNNIELAVDKNFSIVFSPEALEEFINDYGNLRKYKKKD
jgi:hypothetical protein